MGLHNLTKEQTYVKQDEPSEASCTFIAHTDGKNWARYTLLVHPSYHFIKRVPCSGDVDSTSRHSCQGRIEFIPHAIYDGADVHIAKLAAQQAGHLNQEYWLTPIRYRHQPRYLPQLELRK